MAAQTSCCRTCGTPEEEDPVPGKFKLSLCMACHMVGYCSKHCQKENWREHRPYCKAVVACAKTRHMENPTEERRRNNGISANEEQPHRVNMQAERISQEAREHKIGRRFDVAICLYNQAIQLDPFQPMYFHHRGETWMMVAQHFRRPMSPAHFHYLGLAILDAQCALDLDPSCDVPWLTMIRSHMEQGHLESAQKFVEKALQVVPENAWARPHLINYKSELENMQMMPLGRPSISIVSDPKQQDDLFYAYTYGMHSHARHPELIALDLAMAKGLEHCKQLMEWVSQQALAGSLVLELGEVSQLPLPCGGHWISPIPLSIMEAEAETTRKQILVLLGAAESAANIVVLKVDYNNDNGNTPPSPISESQAKEYLLAIANNATQVESLYSRGIKLAHAT